MSEGVEAAPGDIVSETKHASTYRGATASTFEGLGAYPLPDIDCSRHHILLAFERLALSIA